MNPPNKAVTPSHALPSPDRKHPDLRQGGGPPAPLDTGLITNLLFTFQPEHRACCCNFFLDSQNQIPYAPTQKKYVLNLFDNRQVLWAIPTRTQPD